MDATHHDPDFTMPFPRMDETQWRAAVERSLKGGAFDMLRARTADGFRLEPLYASDKTASPRALRAQEGAWRVAARVDHPDGAQANALALADLEGGADALQLVFAGGGGAYGFGLPLSGEALTQALRGVDFDAGLTFEIDSGMAEAARLFADAHAASRADPTRGTISFGLDPIGARARAGAPFAWDAEALAQVCRDLAAKGFAGPFGLTDARIVHAAAGTPGQELAFAIAVALAMWRGLADQGFELDVARRLIGFRLAVDADEFMGVAKLRALRRLWARVEDASGVAPRAIHIHAESAWRMTSRRDSHVNMLRATMASFSAGLGGADVVTTLPFTQALGLSDAFARRIARNAQTILIKEANLARVADPAAGSGAFEALTSALCEAAWTELQTLEREGGIVAALTQGAFQARVAASRAARAKAIATRREMLTGVSAFPNLVEAPAAVLAPAPAEADAALGALPMTRDAAPFEALRDRAEAMAAQGRAPAVFLATLGPPGAFTARVLFAKSLFEAGGIKALGGEACADDDALAQAFAASGATLACLCSSDAIYAERAEGAARALRGVGVRKIYLAGRPPADPAAWAQAGVEGYVFAGCDAPAVLSEAQARA